MPVKSGVKDCCKIIQIHWKFEAIDVRQTVLKCQERYWQSEGRHWGVIEESLRVDGESLGSRWNSPRSRTATASQHKPTRRKTTQSHVIQQEETQHSHDFSLTNFLQR